MRTRRRPPGFTLIELMVVVAILAIVAAIGITALLRARVSANEAGTIGDVRSVISAQALYATSNGGYYERDFTCLGRNGGCIPGMAGTNAPVFLDSVLASLAPKLGYQRSTPQFGPAPPVVDPAISPTSVTTYVYAATPQAQGRTGVRGFAGDNSGRICQTIDGTVPPLSGNGTLGACVQLTQ